MKGVSGSENHLLTLLAGLDKATFEVHLCILAESCHVSLLQDYKKTLEQAGIVVFILIIQKYVNVSLLWRLRHYIIQEQFQIVHTHLIHADLYGTLAAKFAGVSTIVCSRHNDDRFRRYLPLIWLLLRCPLFSNNDKSDVVDSLRMDENICSLYERLIIFSWRNSPNAAYRDA